jgi:hypothetical protein
LARSESFLRCRRTIVRSSLINVCLQFVSSGL